MFAAGGISTLDLILECVKKIKGKDTNTMETSVDYFQKNQSCSNMNYGEFLVKSCSGNDNVTVIQYCSYLYFLLEKVP